MTEREKVIYDIERCICHVPDACKDCSKYGRYNAIRCMEELLTDALSLLKAQEPVEPLTEYSVHTGSKWVICGKCYEPLAKASDKEKPNYCSFCGRPVKWDDND